MSSPASFSDFWHERMQVLSYCPLCETKQHPMQARILGVEGDHCLVHMTCHKCHNAILALVQNNPSGVNSVGMMTDLSFEDVQKFQAAESVNIDDVLSSHDFFSKIAWRERFVNKQAVSQRKRPAKKPSKKEKN